MANLKVQIKFIGMKYAGKVLARAYEKGEIKKNQKALTKAYELGMSL